MAKTIFWAWQSDHDARTGRHLVRAAIEEALAQIAVDTDFEERPQIDHDTKDVRGLAAIADSIFDKIGRCAMFIGDLTPITSRTAKGVKRKWIANPNVLLELGYAKRVLGVDPIILVWNTAHKGTQPGDLPFDLAHRRAPIGYCAPPGCDKATLDAARKTLAADLRAAIMMNLAPEPAPQLAFQRASIGMPSLWLDRAKPVTIIADEECNDWHVDDEPKSWMRLLPATWPRDVRASDLPAPMTLGKPTSLRSGRITGAAFSWSGSDPAKRIRTGTAWFPSDGEMWSFDSSALHGDDQRRRIVVPDLLDRWFWFLRINQERIRTAGGTGATLVQCGVGPLDRVELAIDDRRNRGPIAAETFVSREFVTRSQKETIEEMWQFYRALCDAFGRAAESLEGFQAFALGRLAN
jgi:hypothetical protein